MREARLERCAGLCFGGVFFFEVVARSDAVRWEAGEPDWPASGGAADCGASGEAAINNESRAAKARERGAGEEKPSIIPLYAELDATAAGGEPVA